MTTPTKTRPWFPAQQRAEAVELCLKEGVSCNTVAQRLVLPSSSLARWVRQARIDRVQPGPKNQGPLSSEERAELNRLRKESREIRRQRDFFRLVAAHFAKEQLAEKHSVSWLCQQLGVARRGFYAWRQRQEAPGERSCLEQNPASTFILVLQ